MKTAPIRAANAPRIAFAPEVWTRSTHVLMHSVFLFPYLRLLPVGHPAGVQIQVAVAAIAAIAYDTVRGRIALNALLIPVLAVLPIAVLWPSNWSDVVRSLGIYITMYGGFVYFRHAIRSRFKLLAALKAALFVAASAACLQIFFGRDILHAFVHSRTSEARGVTSLFVEPSFYGLWVVIVTLTVCTFEESRLSRLTFFALAIVQVVFLSQSSIAILMGGSAILVYLTLVRGRLILCALIAVGLVSTWPILTLLREGSRAQFVIAGLLNDPTAVLASDVSIGLRISHILLPVWGTFTNGFVPHGFSAFGDFQETVLLYWPFLLQPSDRIMSGYGSAFFELGFVAFSIVYANFSYLLRPSTNAVVGRMGLTAIAITLFAIYVNAISFALPIFPLIVAVISSPELMAPTSRHRVRSAFPRPTAASG